MTQAVRPARPKPRAAISARLGIATLALIAGLAGCGGPEPLVEPAAPPPPPALPEPTPPATIDKPPSSFSMVVDEAIRRKRLIERLKLILKESAP